jgi:hypothetical protein
MWFTQTWFPGLYRLQAGIPVLDSEMNASVEADVLIGEDGMARAIRFVGFE